MKWLQWAIFAVMLGALYGLNYLFLENMDPYALRVLINIGIAMILSMSLNLVNGCAGQFSLGHAGFMAVGAYSAAALSTILPRFYPELRPLLTSGTGIGGATILGGIIAAFAGLLVGLPSLRLRGDYLAIVTLGFGEIIRIVFLNIPVLGGPIGIPGIPRQTDFFWVYAWAVITFFVIYRLIKSSHGRAILSIRENEIAAESMGINIKKYKVVAFVVSSFFAGIAGGLFAHLQGIIDPGTFNFNRSVEVVIMVVIGGMGSISGAVIGGIVVALLPEALRGLHEFRMIVFPLILILVMLLRPLGILGRHEIWELEIFRRKKKLLNSGKENQLAEVN